MKLCLIASGKKDLKLEGIEVSKVVSAFKVFFEEVVYGGSSHGIMGQVAAAFLEQRVAVTGIVPPWLESELKGIKVIKCRDLSERKNIMFKDIDAVLCYPGGIGTYDELFDVMSRANSKETEKPVEIYIYNFEGFYSPLLDQLGKADEYKMLKSGQIERIHAFCDAEEILEVLRKRYSADN